MNTINNRVVELIKEQESYRDVLYTSLQETDDNPETLYNVSKILLKVNLITKEIYDNGVDDELYDLYFDYVRYLKAEKYLKCKGAHEKIINYTNAKSVERN